MKKMKNITILNIVANLVLQFITLLSGFIIPKLIISTFGSSVNGLIASINQLLSYITLVEGGVTSVVTATLYKPLIEKDDEKISRIVKTSSGFYKKIGIIYIIYSIILAIIYPIYYSDSEFSYIYVLSLILILSISSLIQYMMSLSLRTLLNADKKIYIVSGLQSIIFIINIVLAFLSVKIFPNIHVLKFLTGITYIIQPVFYKKFVNKNYNISKNITENTELLKDRWSGFINNFAYFIHHSTDITILTFATNLKIVSVYSIYTLITNGLKSIINAVSSAISPNIGHLYAKGNSEELHKKFNIYEYINFMIIFIIFTTSIPLITPFVMIYIGKISDTNYYQPLFGILLIITTLIDLLKLPHTNLSYSANKFRQLTKPSFIEATLNMCISILLVKKHSINGIIIGTLVAVLYRLLYQVYFTKKIIGRKQSKFYKKLFYCLITSVVSLCIVYSIIPTVNYDLFSWIISGIVIFVIITISFIISSMFFMKDEFTYLIKMIEKSLVKKAH